MNMNSTNALISKLLLLGAPSVTVFLITGIVSDPVNATKLAVAGGLAGGLAAGLILLRKQIWRRNKALVLAVLAFLLAGFSSVLNSKAPFDQTFYGVSGRNTGFLTYFILAICLLGGLAICETKYFGGLVYGLIAAFALNVLYSGWVLVFGDFISWSNPYKNILGLFGNPDFISAFLGMGIAATVAKVIFGSKSLLLKLSGLVLSSLAFFEILKSHAIQGLVVTFGGLTIVFFYLVRSKFQRNYISVVYVSSAISVGILAVFGTLQMGPLDFLYKKSVSLRGSYWHAGIEMGKKHLWSGVGFDTYGDWYRRLRPDVALVDTPSIHTMSNVSHNVIIDFFAFGGLPLLISYLILLLIGSISVIRVTLRSKEFDSIFVALTVTWACYQAQSIISINQIGLAIWGWVLTGVLVSYEIATRPSPKNDNNNNNSKKTLQKTSNLFSPGLLVCLGILAGLFFAYAPMSADSKYFLAMRTHDAKQVENALKPSFMNPLDSFRLAQAVETFHSSNLDELAHKYALVGTEFNPDFFEGWRQLYQLPNSSLEEKKVAMLNMKRLDPRNPDVVNN